MNWQIGDRAMIVSSKFPERIGLHVTVDSELLTHSRYSGKPFSYPRHYVNVRHVEHPDLCAAYLPTSLVPVHDCREKTTWDESLFKPRVLANVS